MTDTTLTEQRAELIADLRSGAEEQIETARFILSRMRNAPVVADATGNVILRTGGMWPIPKRVGDVAMFKSMDAAKAEAAAQNEAHPSLGFIAMGLHKAAQLQIERAKGILEFVALSESKYGN